MAQGHKCATVIATVVDLSPTQGSEIFNGMKWNGSGVQRKYIYFYRILNHCPSKTRSCRGAAAFTQQLNDVCVFDSHLKHFRCLALVTKSVTQLVNS